ncbi:hypothetical protein BV20DRAFT_694423 [Pilatotrama ljubarskyi]|nr:hypothetical protein BV20DRAFT_694423 [Pilatotrama ljubarskyi]
MAAFSFDVFRLLRDLTRLFPGDHTIYVRNETHSYLEAHHGVASTALTAPIAALMPNVVIKSHTPASRALRPILEARSPSDDVPPRARLQVVDRLVDIIGLVNGHQAAIVREEESLAVWSHDVQDTLSSLCEMQKVLDSWYNDRLSTNTSSWRRPSVLEADRVFDDFLHNYDSVLPSSSGSSLELVGLLVHTELGTLAPLPVLDDVLPNSGPTLSHVSRYAYVDALSPRAIADSPMLGDSPAGLENVYMALRSSSPQPVPSTSPSTLSISNLTPSSLSSSLSPSILSTPATVVPSDLSPHIQSYSPVFDDDLFLMEVDAEPVELKDLSRPATLSIDALTMPIPGPSSSPRERSPEINVIPPANDSLAAESSSAPKIKRGKPVATTAPKSASGRGRQARRAATVQSQSPALAPIPPAPRTRSRASKAHAPETTVASAERVIRPLPARAARSGRSSIASLGLSTEKLSLWSSARVGRSVPHEDELSDADAEGESEYEDNDHSGDYDEASYSDVERQERPRTLKRGRAKTTRGPSKKKKEKESEEDRTCSKCNKIFTRAADCVRHMDICRKKEGPRTRHPCPGCGKNYSRRDAMQRHLRAAEACQRAFRRR